MQLYNSIESSLPPKERHQLWLQEFVQQNRRRMSTITNFTLVTLAKIHQMWQCSYHSDLYLSLGSPEKVDGQLIRMAHTL